MYKVMFRNFVIFFMLICLSCGVSAKSKQVKQFKNEKTLEPVVLKNVSYLTDEDNTDGKIDFIQMEVNKDVDLKKEITKEGFFKDSLHFLKGVPVDNSIMMLMYSYHTRGDREELNESNKLAAIDLAGYSIGTFNNSYHVQSYYIGIGRKIYDLKLPKNFDMDFKYRFVILRGYRRYEPDLGGFTPTIIPMVGFTKKQVGIDFLLSAGKTMTFATNLRYNLPNLR